MIIQVTSPIGVTVSIKIKRATSKIEAMVNGPLMVSKDMLGRVPMSSGGGIKMLT
jgi:hypothetical protein